MSSENDLIKRWARPGAEAEYEALLRRQAMLNRMFPGVNKAAKLRLQQEQAALARSAKRKAG